MKRFCAVVTATCHDVYMTNVPSVAQKGQRTIPDNIFVLCVSRLPLQPKQLHIHYGSEGEGGVKLVYKKIFTGVLRRPNTAAERCSSAFDTDLIRMSTWNQQLNALEIHLYQY